MKSLDAPMLSGSMDLSVLLDRYNYVEPFGIPSHLRS
jgi:hypothetical protein